MSCEYVPSLVSMLFSLESFDGDVNVDAEMLLQSGEEASPVLLRCKAVELILDRESSEGLF